MPSLKTIKSSFVDKADNSLRFVQNLNDAMNTQRITFKNTEISFIYEVSFIKIFTAWEKFLEDTFIGYLEGRFTKALKPKLITKRMNGERAYALLKGTKQYPDWTKVEEVLTLASLLFTSFNPYDQVLRATNRDLTQMKVIRNSITHISKSSADAFRKLIRSELSSYNIDMNPGEFLTQNRT